ncbi:HAMP domain-containing sensor histidine kinase [Microvirga sp. VF16]|uniref:sensor histidine kinase n=1 Tax=Microvirga sp. VF16 TaxID=2807101 RepID=UPI00193CAB9E|nr:HAMP domain-containing sensor histidine kinase [Microvirga sp. VF16]QRM27601.1 HAMP domain-containing histidine kinase [Microvirga sp. VF16]
MNIIGWFQRFFPFPRTLRWRLFVILFAGLAAAHALSFGVLFLERYMTAKTMMLGNLEKDVGTSIALLERLPANERQQWVAMLERGNYRYELGPGLHGVPELSRLGVEIAETIREAAGHRFPVTVEAIPGSPQRLQAHVTLSDGAQVTIDLRPKVMPLAVWLPYVLIAQLLLLILCTWFAVRLAIRPLLRLANAAEALDPSRKAVRLEETGPTEVAYAATAFNAMRDRIAYYLEERVQILAAISHDLQTPITRMKLRAEMAEDSPDKEKLINDLSEIERLVREGVTYARTAYGNVEKSARIDISSFVESIVFDYQDTGKAVTSPRIIDAVVVTRPHALRRILTNLIDNALKFAGEAEVNVRKTPEGRICITVLDNGPGIPDGQLEAVLQPFYRLEQSRNRNTGGTGLGLAIAHQLALAIGGSLNLKNRSEGGLAAEIVLG